MNKSGLIWSLFCLSFLGAGQLSAQSKSIDVATAPWETDGEVVTNQRVLGRPALQIRTGVARLPDMTLEDGTIEFDMAVSGDRSFAYIFFRTDGDGEHEEIYFRPHKSSLPDAIQYTPVYNRVSNWQLYHGRGYTSAVEMPPNTWIPVRLVMQGPRAALFVGDLAKPQLLIPLAREPRAGGIAFRAFLPQGKPEGVYPASFSNLRISPGVVDYDFSKVEIKAPTAPAGSIREFAVSAPFEAGTLPIDKIVEKNVANLKTFSTEGSGLLLLDKHIAPPDSIKTPAIVARVVVRADKEGLKALNFGFSDTVTIFLNGRPLFSGDASYSFDRPRREGLIGLDQGTVYLPLKSGDNELVFAVSETFGGWGLMARFPNQEGVSVTAR